MFPTIDKAIVLSFISVSLSIVTFLRRLVSEINHNHCYHWLNLWSCLTDINSLHFYFIINFQLSLSHLILTSVSIFVNTVVKNPRGVSTCMKTSDFYWFLLANFALKVFFYSKLQYSSKTMNILASVKTIHGWPASYTFAYPFFIRVISQI